MDAHVAFDPVTDTYKQDNNNGHEEIEATLIPFSPYLDPRQAKDIPNVHSTWLKIYPDSGAIICLGGLKHLWHMGLSERNLVSSRKKVCTIEGFVLVCQGWLPVTFRIGDRSMKQALYICSKVQVIYFRKETCIDVGILPPCFPKSMTAPPSVTCDAIHHKINPPANKTKFNNPKTPPYPPTSENIQKLKEKLLN